jgi:branched-chain amino acid transport system ATP-binding protein
VSLSLQNVTQRFGALAAVDNVSFEVENGEALGIAGPNGAGKTTLFNTICGFHRPEGKVLLDGIRLDTLQPHRICRLGVARTFQIPAPLDSMTVRQNVEVGAVFGGARHRRAAMQARVDEALDRVGMREQADLPIHTLKLYDKKLTLLAAALATGPSVLLLDEAAAGLSALEMRELFELIQRLNREDGLTLLVIEHIMSILTGLCDRILVMNDGKVLAIGKADAVMATPEVKEVLLG